MRTTVQATAAALLAVGMLGAGAGTASAAGAGASLSMPFKAATTAIQTGLTMDLRYFDRDDPDAKPPTIQKLAIHLPAGTRIDTTAVPVCEATDGELDARGRDACPAESQVGDGKLEVYFGAPGDPQKTDLVLYNKPSEIMEVLFFEGTNQVAAIEHLKVEGTTISGNPAQVPPVGDQRASASKILWDVPPRGGYLVTPPACPAAGAWRTTGEFEFADGSKATAGSDQACRGPKQAGDAGGPGGGTGSDGPGDRGGTGGPASGRVAVFVSPRRFRRGRATALRVRLESDVPRCVRGAVVRVGTRSARTGDDGRATLRALVRYLRRPLLRVQTPCGRVTATLHTRRR